MNAQAKAKLIRLIATTPGVMRIGPVYASSGTVVPVVPDFRALYSYPRILRLLGRLIACEAKTLKIEVLAGIETAGIPLVAAASLASGISMVYLRKAAHSGWKRSIIDGAYRLRAVTALVDDAVTFGGQKTYFIKKLKGELKVKAVIVIWDSSYPSRYRQALKRAGVAVRALVTKIEVMDYMLARGLMRRDTYEVMLAQTNNPWDWHKHKASWAKFKIIKQRGLL